jgi:hypothetical protein
VPQRSFKEGSDPVRRRIACGLVDENETWTLPLMGHGPMAFGKNLAPSASGLGRDLEFLSIGQKYELKIHLNRWPNN